MHTVKAPRALLAPFLLAFSSAAPALAQNVVYEVRGVAPPSAKLVSEVLSLNDNGQVVGDTYNAFPDDAVGFRQDSAGFVDLAPLPGTVFTSPTRIFASGRTIGLAGLSISNARGVVWSPDGQPRELRRLPGHAFTAPLGGNGDGTIVGLASQLLGQSDQPVAWQNGVLHQLPRPQGKAFGRMDGIDANGRMVGSAWNFPGGDDIGYMLDPDGTITTVGPLPGGTFTHLIDVNDAGVTVGFGSDSAGFLKALYHKDGQLSGFAPLPGDLAAILIRVNRRGAAVGYSQSQTTLTGILCDGKKIIDLNTLLDPATGNGWFILLAQTINNQGQIGGIALDPLGQIVGCVLTPVPGPQSTGNAGSARVERPIVRLPDALRERWKLAYGLRF